MGLWNFLFGSSRPKSKKNLELSNTTASVDQSAVLDYETYLARVTRATLAGAPGEFEHVLEYQVRCFACEKSVRGVERAIEKPGNYALECPECQTFWIVYERCGPSGKMKALLRRALELDKQGEIDDAVRCCEEAIEHDPKCAMAWSLKGGILPLPEHIDEAIKCLRIATELDSELKGAWNDLGYTLSQKVDFQGAIDAYDQALRIDSRFVDCLHNKTVALGAMQEFKSACDCAKKVLKIDPNDGMAWYNLGASHANMGQMTPAQQCLRKSQQLGYAPAGELLSQLR